MWYIYFLKSQKNNKYCYVGSTNDITRRIAEHNKINSSLSTSPYKPLKLVGYIAVEKEKKARELEKYFKTGSGRAFLNRKILPDEACKA